MPRKTQSAARDDDLRRPAIACALCSRIPDSVPIERDILSVGDQAVVPRAGSIDLKEVASAVVAIRIQDYGDGVVAREIAVALHSMNRNALRFGVMADEPKIETILSDDDADFCGELRWRLWLRGLLHQAQYWCIAPYRLVQFSIQSN